MKLFCSRDKLNFSLVKPSFYLVKPTKLTTKLLFATSVFLSLAACSDATIGAATKESAIAGVGPNPNLPAPHKNLIPTVNIAPALGWPVGGTPVAASDLTVSAFVRNLDHPRWLYVLPNGDVLVAETNTPAKAEGNKGIKAWVAGVVMKKAGATTASANRIRLLRDINGDGIADINSVLLEGLNSPFGMTLVGNNLYVANADAVFKYPYVTGDIKITAKGTKLIDLPGGPINHHWTKNIIASADGSKLYITVGSNSNVAENGMAAEEQRAAIWALDLKTAEYRLFASGLRNPNGLAWEPISQKLWVVVNERDELGNDLVPDYLTSVQEGGFYGWPYSYYGAHIDERVTPQDPVLVAQALIPDYALGAHTASLGLASALGTSLPTRYRDGMFVGQHGSWNRKPLSGYKVIFVPFTAGKPNGMPLDVLSGFLSPEGNAFGRPVGVALDKQGALLVADDVGNAIWRVTARK